MSKTKKGTAKNADAAIVDIPHEVIESPNGQPAEKALIILSAEQKAEQEIARFDVNREKILEVKEKFKDLTIAGVDDTTGYKAVEKAWQGLRNMRLAVEKKHKEVKADYLTITKAIDGHKNELVELIQEDGGEKHFGQMLEDIDKQKEELKNKKEREDQERLQGRVNELLANGMAFNGSFYAIGDAITMDVVSIKNMDDSAYNGLLSRVKELNAAMVAEKEKKEREAEAEKARQAALSDVQRLREYLHKMAVQTEDYPEITDENVMMKLTGFLDTIRSSLVNFSEELKQFEK